MKRETATASESPDGRSHCEVCSGSLLTDSEVDFLVLGGAHVRFEMSCEGHASRIGVRDDGRL